MLEDGFHDVPEGRVAAVVTHLEMPVAAPLRGAAAPDGVRLQHVPGIDVERYLTLFRRVGARDWLWFSRLSMATDALQAILGHPDVAVHVLTDGAQDLGLLELDWREGDACELAFFGLAPELMGRGAGGWLMDQAISLAFARPIQRFHVHTCTLDSPQALGFYIRSGFTPLRQQIEIAPDPRLKGLIDTDAAPQIPIFRP
ncbi:MAG: GNAT family N-acetyltransferase [Paracoccaceae bacterium]|nr:GNAT family N-acetyltransferase [Paracoccaceae bacterium]